MNQNNLNESEKAILLLSRTTAVVAIFFVLIVGILVSLMIDSTNPVIKVTAANTEAKVSTATSSSATNSTTSTNTPEIPADNSWIAPDDSTIPKGKEGDQIRYGKELVAHTANYLGPKGSVMQMSNGMNCQNCHNEGGTKAFAFNFSAVASSYPQFKSRSNSWISIAGRINGCFQRSLNGAKLDTASKEMIAMVAYMKWL